MRTKCFNFYHRRTYLRIYCSVHTEFETRPRPGFGGLKTRRRTNRRRVHDVVTILSRTDRAEKCVRCSRGWRSRRSRRRRRRLGPSGRARWVRIKVCEGRERGWARGRRRHSKRERRARPEGRIAARVARGWKKEEKRKRGKSRSPRTSQTGTTTVEMTAGFEGGGGLVAV